jgi:hypothetical protein
LGRRIQGVKKENRCRVFKALSNNKDINYEYGASLLFGE